MFCFGIFKRSHLTIYLSHEPISSSLIGLLPPLPNSDRFNFPKQKLYPKIYSSSSK